MAKEILYDLIVNNIGVIGCLFVVSFLIFYTLVGFRFYNSCNHLQNNNRWNNNNVGKFGGVGIFCLFVIIINLWKGSVEVLNNNTFLESLFVLFLLGFMDDIKNISIKLRILIYSIVCIAMLKIFGSVSVEWLFYFIFMFFMINSTNMLDNMDMISIVTAWIIFIQISILSEDIRFIILTIILIPFAYFNFMGKLWMGNCGSTVLGMIYAVCGIWLYRKDVSWYSILMIMIIPITDTCFIIIRRLIEKKKPWIGDTRHLTHVLVRRYGESQAVAILILYGLIFGIIGVNLR